MKQLGQHECRTGTGFHHDNHLHIVIIHMRAQLEALRRTLDPACGARYVLAIVACGVGVLISTPFLCLRLPSSRLLVVTLSEIFRPWLHHVPLRPSSQ